MMRTHNGELVGLTDEAADERVREGVAVLDKHGPPEWRGTVDWAHLDVENACGCVLGQVYGGEMFDGYRKEHGEPTGWGVGMGLLGAFVLGEHHGGDFERGRAFSTSHGFDRDTDNDGGTTGDYEVLRAAWVRWAVFNGLAGLSLLAGAATRADRAAAAAAHGRGR